MCDMVNKLLDGCGNLAECCLSGNSFVWALLGVSANNAREKTLTGTSFNGGKRVQPPQPLA